MKLKKNKHSNRYLHIPLGSVRGLVKSGIKLKDWDRIYYTDPNTSGNRYLNWDSVYLWPRKRIGS